MQFSVVIPMYNEAENAAELVREIAGALEGHSGHEIVVVDDGSADDTPERLQQVQSQCPQLRVVRHKGNFGQSAAIATGVKVARGPWVVTLDGDGQNDPADIPAMMEVAREAQTGAPLLVAGNRRKRNDTWVRRMSSRVANRVRSGLLRDDCPDTGCGLKVFRRDLFLQLPQFDHMHRFLPALFKRAGARVVNVSVNHRPRQRGQSKYGISNRLWVGIIDLFGVAWLLRRPLQPQHDPVAVSGQAPESDTAAKQANAGSSHSESAES